MSIPSKIVCVGRNYLAHAAEMGAARPSEPLLFLKPPSALVAAGQDIVLPGFSAEVHHEVEMVLRVGRRLVAASEGDCEAAVDAVAIGLDLTARDVQAEAKSKGHPWAVAKGFDGSAPIGSWAAVRGAAELADLELRLEVNGELRQSGRTAAMIWSVPQLLAFVSSRFTLEPGDFVFTGTPEGVGPIQAGDAIDARLGDLSRLRARVA